MNKPYIKKEGYVYLVEFEDGCYKIGSSLDPFARLWQLVGDFGNAELVLVGKASDAIFTEREIQFVLNRLSNRHNIWCRNHPDTKYIGSEKSQEFFTFNNYEVHMAIAAFKKRTEICYIDYNHQELVSGVEG